MLCVNARPSALPVLVYRTQCATAYMLAWSASAAEVVVADKPRTAVKSTALVRSCYFHYYYLALALRNSWLRLAPGSFSVKVASLDG